MHKLTTLLALAATTAALSAPASAIMHDSLPLVEAPASADLFANAVSDAPDAIAPEFDFTDASIAESADWIDILKRQQ